MAYFGGVSEGSPWARVDFRVLSFGVLAVACLALAAVVLTQVTSSSSDTVDANGGPRVIGMREVLVAKEDIRPGQRLLPELFATETRPVEVGAAQIVSNFTALEGRFAKGIVRAGSIAVADDFSTEPLLASITARIPEGYRAVTIPVDSQTGVEGWAAAGARVDVVWRVDHAGKPVVTTVVEDAKILSAERVTEQEENVRMAKGKASEPSGAQPRFVTLLVSLEDSHKIVLAKAEGTLSLILRGDGDRAGVGNDTLTYDMLMRRSDLIDQNQPRGRIQYDGEEFYLDGETLVKSDKDSQRGKVGSDDAVKARMR